MTALSLYDVTVRHHQPGAVVTAVDGVSLEVPSGGAVGLVGESGCGKSSLARAIVGLTPYDGRILLDGHEVRTRTLRDRRRLAQLVQMVFQDPDTALDPRMTVRQTLMEALSVGRRTSGLPRMEQVVELLTTVGLPTDLTDRLPSRLSGGQRQRVAIARALAVGPGVVVADEVTSALDATAQASVLGLLRGLRARLGLSLLFISHDLAAVRCVADIIAVMYLGRIVETAPTETLLRHPRHPYTQALLASVPCLRGPRRILDEPVLPQWAADPLFPPPGCRFHPRCPVGPRRLPERTLCATAAPGQTPVDHDQRHHVACHFPVAPDSRLR